jgi:hypothetical protein
MEVTIGELIALKTTATVDSGVPKTQMAINPNTDPQLLRQLAASENWDLRRVIASNPNTPTDLLWELGIDFPEVILANPIFELLQLEHLNLAAEIPHATLTSLLQCDRVPRAFMDYAVNQQDYSLWLAIAYNPQTPSTLLKNLVRKSRRQDRELVRAVAAHPNTSAHLLAEISEIGSGLAQIVAKNPQTPVVVLQNILQQYGQTNGAIFKTLVALHPQIDPQLLMQMNITPDEAAAQSLWLAKQSDTDSIQLVELAQTKWDVLQLAIVRHPNTLTEQIDRIWSQIQMQIVDRSNQDPLIEEDVMPENRLIYDSFIGNANTSAQLRERLRKLLKW